jgi:hypothetical protein
MAILQAVNQVPEVRAAQVTHRRDEPGWKK